mgnify:FL=1
MPTYTIHTHAILSRFDTPIRVAALSDWRAMADIRSAAALAIGCYTLAEVGQREAERTEDLIAGRKAAGLVMAGDGWIRAIAA